MLIYLDPLLIDYFKSNELCEADLEALDNIITSHRNGFHFVFSNRKTLEYLSELRDLGTFNKKQLKLLSNDYTTFSMLPMSVSNKIEVIPSNQEFARIDTLKEDNLIQGYQYTTSIFKVPLWHFLNPEILVKTRLVSENIDDCYFYEYIGNKFSSNNLPCKINIEPDTGGGNDTYKTFKDKIEQNNMVFAIVDSDKKEPSMNLGNTSLQVSNLYDGYKQNTISYCEILPFHEKENLFSATVYEKLGVNICEYAVDQFKLIENYDENFCFIPYIDVKEGISSSNYFSHFESLFDIPNLIPQNQEECRGFHNEYIGTKRDFIHYYNEQLTLEKRARTKKYLINPIGSNPLGNFDFDALEEKLITKLNEAHPNTPSNVISEIEEKIEMIRNLPLYLLDSQKKYLTILGTQIKEWGLAKPKF